MNVSYFYRRAKYQARASYHLVTGNQERTGRIAIPIDGFQTLGQYGVLQSRFVVLFFLLIFLFLVRLSCAITPISGGFVIHAIFLVEFLRLRCHSKTLIETSSLLAECKLLAETRVLACAERYRILGIAIIAPPPQIYY